MNSKTIMPICAIVANTLLPRKHRTNSQTSTAPSNTPAEKEETTMPDKETLKNLLAEKQKQFKEATDAGDFDEAFEINREISDIMLALYS